LENGGTRDSDKYLTVYDTIILHTFCPRGKNDSNILLNKRYILDAVCELTGLVCSYTHFNVDLMTCD